MEGEGTPYMDGWGDVARDDISPFIDMDAGDGALSDPSYRSLSIEDLCLGNTPNSWSLEESLPSRRKPVLSGARTGFITGVP